MKTICTLAVALSLSGLACAEGPIETEYASQPFVAMKSRQEVIAETLAFLQNPPDEALWTSTLSREEVVAEAIAADRSGETAAMTGEDSGSFWLAAHEPKDALGETFRVVATRSTPAR